VTIPEKSVEPCGRRAAYSCPTLAAPLRRTIENGENTMHITRKSRRGPGRYVAIALAAAAAAAAMGTGGTAHAATLELSGPSRVLFITNEVANSVTEYKTNADGDTSPITTIAGANTGLSAALGIALAG
jgi:hypothetical protein